MKLAESLFGARIQLWIVWLEIPSSAAISEIGRPLVSVRSIIARRSCSVCRGLRIFESPSIRKTQAYEAHAGGARTPGSGRLRQWSDDEIAAATKIIAEGAITFGMNALDPNTKIVFNMDDWISLDKQSGPYVQYTCARIRSLLKKAGINEAIDDFKVDRLNSLEERSLILALGELNNVVVAISERLNSSLMCSYLLDVCRAFNRFYAEHKVVVPGDEELTRARSALSQSTIHILERGLKLLAIDVPQRM